MDIKVSIHLYFVRSVLFYQRQKKAAASKHKLLSTLPWNLTLSCQENVERLLLRVKDCGFNANVNWEMQVLKGKQLLQGPMEQLACLLDDTAAIILLSDATQEKRRSADSGPQRFGEIQRIDYGAEFEDLIADLISHDVSQPKLAFDHSPVLQGQDKAEPATPEADKGQAPEEQADEEAGDVPVVEVDDSTEEENSDDEEPKKN